MREMLRSEFYKEFKTLWFVGQHVTLVGTTGDGKTVLAEHLYELRKFVVVIATKASDDSLDDYSKDFYRTKKWPVDWYKEKVIFWERPDKLGDFSEQREAIYRVLSDIYKKGNRTVGLDDVAYLSGTLRLDDELRMLYTQSRSQNISLVGNIQRPYRVPLEVTNQASHVLLFGVRDRRDVERLVEAQGLSKVDVVSAVEKLHKYDFAWIRTGSEPIIVRNEVEK